MPKLLLLVGDLTKARNDNHVRFAASFERAGWQVVVADHETLETRRGALTADGLQLDDFELVWPLGFGQQATFFDRMQMLHGIEPWRFVTCPDVLVYLHGKHRWLNLMPETHTSTRAPYLLQILSSGGDWVVKPTAGSYGRDVELIREGEITPERLDRLLRRASGGYLMAQRFVPEVRQGEKRTLLAGGRVLGSYLRLPQAGFISNLAAGGEPLTTELTSAEARLIAPLARELADLGAGFAAIDTVHPFLMEVNVANPGGLATLSLLTGRDPTDAAVAAIIDWQTQRRALFSA